MDRAGAIGWPERMDDWAFRSLVRLVLAVGILLGLLVLAMLVPGAERDLPAMEMSIGELVSAVVSLALVVLFLQVATRTRAIIRRYWEDRREIARPLAGIAHWTIVYAVVIIAYEGLRGVAQAIVYGTAVMWAYDMAFFALGVFVLVLIGYHLFTLLDPLAELCTRKFTSEPVGDRDTVQTKLPVDTPTEDRGWSDRRW